MPLFVELQKVLLVILFECIYCFSGNCIKCWKIVSWDWTTLCVVGRNALVTSVWWPNFAEGQFQSDALLVPEGCLFDHIHNQSRCWQFDLWNTTADDACKARHLNLKAFAMLLPCGIDVFSGVEFVCCPKTYKGEGTQATDSLVLIYQQFYSTNDVF